VRREGSAVEVMIRALHGSALLLRHPGMAAGDLNGLQRIDGDTNQLSIDPVRPCGFAVTGNYEIGGARQDLSEHRGCAGVEVQRHNFKSAVCPRAAIEEPGTIVADCRLELADPEVDS